MKNFARREGPVQYGYVVGLKCRNTSRTNALWALSDAGCVSAAVN